ncbi:MAG TPA: hypothetical protein VFP84_24105 [Kofleriaceae bacterium]|nr:hypothetical protein [Kofleriaceae bacterium]
MMTIVVLATTRDPHRQAEALRAALGLTLRGTSVAVWLHAPLHTPLAQRAADTLRAFGHRVTLLDADADAQLREALALADRVEVWT